MNALNWQNEISRVAGGIRKRVLQHSIQNNGGYLSQACSSAEIFASLYVKVMNLEKLSHPFMPSPFQGVPSSKNSTYKTGAIFNGSINGDYDRFFLSPAQYALVLYATLIEVDRMQEDGLKEFNQDGSSVEMIGAEHSPGMESMTGSLGQGISQAAGAAKAYKLKRNKGRIFVFMSDGEFQIGQTWEAVQAMSFHKLDNMFIYIDINGHQCDGKMDTVMNIEPLEKRLESFGARVFRVNGHNPEILCSLGNLPPEGKPTFILADTSPYNGIAILKKRFPKFHYLRFTSEEEKLHYQLALHELEKNMGLCKS
ncbi:MAG: transketolase [Leptospiraceae bacterium]|nr:transketolase [Leptospiraceae bacterium]